MKEKKIKYYLGLDLGISSIGWAISSSEKELIDFGVQKWNPPFLWSNDGKKIGTKAAERRGYRAELRLTNRKKMRKRELKKLLEALPSFAELKNYDSISDWVVDLNKTKNVYDLKYNSINKNAKLSAKELGWVLLNYINRRGEESFSSTKEITSKSFTEKHDLKNLIKLEEESINPINDIIKHKNNKSFTLNNKYNVKNTVYMRSNLKRECSILLNHQKINKEIANKILDLIFTQLKSEDGPDSLHGKNADERKQNRLNLIKKLKKEQDTLMGKKNKTKEDYKKIKVLRERRTALHHYLPLRELRGKCPYYIDEDKAPNSSIIKSLFNYCYDANLDKNKRHLVLKDALKTKFKQTILSFFQIKDMKILKEDCKFWYYLNEYLPKFKMKRLDCFKQSLLLNNSIPKTTLEELESFIDMLNDLKKISSTTTTEELKNLLKKIMLVDKKVFSKFSDYSSLDSQYKILKPFLKDNIISTQDNYQKYVYAHFSTADFSLKVMYDALIAFLDGKVINQFLNETKKMADYIPFNKLPKLLDQTFTITKILNLASNNSTVFRALSQIRQCIKKIHSYYRKELNIPDNEFLFDSINISIGGGFKLTQSEKKEADKQIEENIKLNKWIQKIIFLNGMNNNNNTKDLIRLFLEQGGKVADNKKDSQNATCLLTPGKNNISLDDIKYNRVDNGHIIPKHLGGIHNIKNRFIVLKEANRLQANKLPFQYIKSLKNKEWEEEYKEKLNDLYMNNKSKRNLLLIENKKDPLFQEYKEHLSKVWSNNNRHISRIVVSWLTNELIKRDYILNNKKLIDKNKNVYLETNENAYKKWFSLKYDEILQNRINQVSHLATSYIRKNILFNKIDKSKRFDKNGAWAFHGKGRIKKLTDWDYAIDGIALSCIHNKEALFFYEYYSNALRNYWNIAEKLINEKKPIKDEIIKNYKEDIQRYKRGILIYLKKIQRPLHKNLYWYNIVNTYFDNLENIFNDYLDKPCPIKKPKTPKALSDLFSNFENKIQSLIPIKLSWYRMNDLSYNFLDQIIKYPKSLDSFKSHLKNLEEIMEKKMKDDFLNNVKGKIYSKHTPKKEYILFSSFFKDYEYNLQNYFNKKDLSKGHLYIKNLEEIFSNLNFICSNLKSILNNKKNLKRFKFCNNPFDLYELINETNNIDSKIKERIINFIFANEIGLFQLYMTTNVHVSDLDLYPNKVIKYYLCGKLKNRKPLMTEKTPLRISNNGFLNNKSVTLEKMINKKGINEDYVEIKNEINKFRKNPTKLKQIKINNMLKKYWVYIDKQGSLWATNSFVGWIINDKENEKTRPLSAHEINHSSLSELIDINEDKMFIPFGENICLANTKIKNYPIIFKEMKRSKGDFVYITLNGVSTNALRIKDIYGKRIRPTMNDITKQKYIWINMKKNSFKKTRIDFNGNII